MSAVGSTHAVYTSLVELRNHVSGIILPEAQRHLLATTPSVMAMVRRLHDIQALMVPTGLDQLVSQLETQLLNVIMGLQVRLHIRSL